jgi:hypothetical protein
MAGGDCSVRGETRMFGSVLNVVDPSCARIKRAEWKPIKPDSNVTFLISHVV